MNLKNIGSNKIKRRNFFYYLGASVFGIFSISKLSVKIFKSRLNNKLTGEITVKPNPYSVKRDAGSAKNG
jgi:hypothetical protein